MKRGAADLNLLLVFEAVLEDRSITKAASRLGLSQPALSHALNRLRVTLKDQLFVRSPSGMVPTPRAEALAWPVRQALAGLEEILEAESFVPAEADRQFTIAVNNYAAIVLAPAIATSCASRAPGVRLTIRPSGTLDLLGLMDRGEVDLVLSAPRPPAERIRCRELVSDDYVAVTRQDHPTAGRRLDMATLAALPHLSISSSRDDMSFFDTELERCGLRRSIALDAPFLSTGAILTRSDMLAILARNVAKSLARAYAIELRPLPFESGRVVTSMFWARRFDDQAAHRWLRSIVEDAAGDVAG